MSKTFSKYTIPSFMMAGVVAVLAMAPNSYACGGPTPIGKAPALNGPALEKIFVSGKGKSETPPPTIDTDGDGKADAWDRDGNGIADAWDTDGDGKPDLFDDNGDGKPDQKLG